MTLEYIIDEIKFRITGGILELELDDVQLSKGINAALREMQRYLVEPKIITIPYQSCLDLSKYKVDQVYKVQRATGLSDTNNDTMMQDPIQTQLYQMTALNNMTGASSYMMNYASYQTMNQIKNTFSTDLIYTFDRDKQKLYINVNGNPGMITILYVPVIDSVEDITSSYWQDILIQLATAIIKTTLGRIRTRYTQSNSLWVQDGQQMLSEGTQELQQLREILRQNTNYFTPID